MISYVFFIKSDENRSLLSARCPDLAIQFNLSTGEKMAYKQCQEVLLADITQKEQLNRVINSASEFERLVQEPDELLCIISTDYSLKQFCFERAAPWFGYGARIVTASTFSLTTFLAVSVVDKGKESEGFSYTAAMLGFIMTIVIYTFSQAPKFLAGVFRKVDDFFFREPDEKFSWNEVNSQLLAKIALYMFIIAIGIGDVAFTSIVRFQSTVSLGGDNDNESRPAWLTEDLVYFIAILLAVSHFSTDIVFETAFTTSAARTVWDFFTERKNKSDSGNTNDYLLLNAETNPVNNANA